MNNILGTLDESQIAVDLGCGGGSFNYMAHRCRILGIDVTLDQSRLKRNGSRIDYVQSTSAEIPLCANSVDAVICNHTLEHFHHYENTLREIGRILKPKGLMWISVPNGFGFEDALYRMLYSGGGHVNRFTFQSMVDAVQNATDLVLIQSNRLYSGFVYLTALHHYHTVFVLNGGTRIIDKLLGTQLSLYGWGFVFARAVTQLDPLDSYFNVCCSCGSGDPISTLKSSGRIRRRLGFRLYECSNCRQTNVLIEPPSGVL